MQVLELMLVGDQMLDIGDHVHPAVMGVGLAG